MRPARGAILIGLLFIAAGPLSSSLQAQRLSLAVSPGAPGPTVSSSNHVKRHWLLGAGVGAVAGGVVGAIAANTDDNGDRQTLESTLIGAGVGLVVGGAIGYFITTETGGGQAAIPVFAYQPGPAGGRGTIAWRMSY